jgi:2-dehydro-3-deoxyphosphooctonate aldolase (KDO 8-P synthase)
LLIAGPCVIESEELCREVAAALCEYSRERDINFVFKPASIRPTAPRFTLIVGPGLENGLRILERIKNEYSIPVLTEVHERDSAKRSASVRCAADSGFPVPPDRLVGGCSPVRHQARPRVNVKKGQFLAP